MSTSNREVAHLWASRSRSEGSGSNFYFDGDVIYSYGRHFPIAKHVNDFTVLFTTRRYSNTTSKHISLARNAVCHKRIVWCHNQEQPIAENVKHERAVSEELLSLIALTKHKGRIAKLAGQYHQVASRAIALIELARSLGEDIADQAWTSMPEDIKAAACAHRERVEELQRAAQAEREARREALIAEAKVLIRKWRAGSNVNVSGFVNIPTALRIRGDKIETSLGASIPVASVTRELWRRVMVSKATGMPDQCDGMPRMLGDYKITRIESDGTLVVGCHRIPFNELNRMARALWANSEGVEA